MAVCKLCNQSYKVITNTHLRAAHGKSIRDYTTRFGMRGVGFSINTMQLVHSDPRWQAWKHSLEGRKTGWSKGLTKETDLRVAKISKTMRERNIDNLKKYRESRPKPPDLPRNADCAECMGVVLGDGHIEKFPRTESLTIVGNTNNSGFIARYSRMITNLFHKKPHISFLTGKNAVRMRIYQNDISKRLGIPTGNRRYATYTIPNWIWTNRKNLIKFLRGLYEAEGSFCIHKRTSTYKLFFSNRNSSLLDIVFLSLQKLGFHPHRSRYLIQLSRKEEVLRCVELIEFRKYDKLDSG